MHLCVLFKLIVGDLTCACGIWLRGTECVVQNIRVISKYYSRIAFPRLAQLLKLDEDVRCGGREHGQYCT